MQRVASEDATQSETDSKITTAAQLKARAHSARSLQRRKRSETRVDHSARRPRCLFKQSLGLSGINMHEIHHYTNRPLPEFRVRTVKINHVVVDNSSRQNERGRGDAVECKLLRGTGFQTRRPGEDLWTGI